MSIDAKGDTTSFTFPGAQTSTVFVAGPGASESIPEETFTYER
jgi:hypothetical protein